jgi:hypothetical protein
MTNYKSELNSLVLEFKSGVVNEDEFEDLCDELNDLADDIEDFDERENTIESSSLFKKAEAIAKLVQEISPDGGKGLTIEQYELAAPILGLTAYEHKPPDGKEFCIPVVQFFLWDYNYQALFLLNNTDTKVFYKANVISDNGSNNGFYSNCATQWTIDCYSMVAIGGKYTTSEGSIKCKYLECEISSHCSQN